MLKPETKSLFLSYFNNKKLRYSLFILFFPAVFLFILYLNIHTPLFGDDITYLFIFPTTEKVENFSDILYSQYVHYNIWGGRSVVHAIAQVLLMLPPFAIDILNSLAFVALILLIYTHINHKKPFSVTLLIGIFLLLWFLQPFAETILWITGSANYLWGTLIILFFLLPYRLYNNKKRSAGIMVLSSVAMFVFGIVAGWTNENIAGAMLLIIILFWFYYRSKGWKIPLWLYTGFIGGIIGFIIMITAPGNYLRGADVGISPFLIVYRLFRHTQALFNNIGFLTFVFIVLFVLLKKKSPDNKHTLYLSLIYETGAIAAVYAMVLSPSFPDRAWFGIICLNIISVGILVVNYQDRIVRNLKYGLVLLGFLIFVFNLYDIDKEIKMVEQTIKERNILIEEGKKNGSEYIVFDEYHTKTKYAVPDPTYSSIQFSRIYGIKIYYRKDLNNGEPIPESIE